MVVSKEVDSFYELQNTVWGQAIRVLNEVAEHDMEDEFMQHLEDTFDYTTVDETELNDYIAYDWEYIYECIGLDLNEEEEEE